MPMKDEVCVEDVLLKELQEVDVQLQGIFDKKEESRTTKWLIKPAAALTLFVGGFICSFISFVLCITGVLCAVNMAWKLFKLITGG